MNPFATMPLGEFLQDVRELLIRNAASPRLIDKVDELTELVDEADCVPDSHLEDELYDVKTDRDSLVEEIEEMKSMISTSYEETGICACGKIEADGIRCRLGASHRPRAQSFPWVASPRPAEAPPMRENKACFPWEPKP